MSSGSAPTLPPTVYPKPRRDETVVDDYHGVKIHDPYRWMEDAHAEETHNYVLEQNKISEAFLAAAPDRANIQKRLTEMWNYEKYGCTSRHGDFYYYYHNSGLQNQFVLYQQKSLADRPGRVFFDPNLLSTDGCTAIRMSSWSKDGTIFAYGLSEKGSDWATIKFRKADGTDLPDEVRGVKFSAIGWMPGNEGVFYSKYPNQSGATDAIVTTKGEFHSLYYHRLGTKQTEDVLIFDYPKDPDYMVSGTVSEDGKLLILDISPGCHPSNMILYCDLSARGNAPITGKLDFHPLFDRLDAKYDYIDHDETSVLVQTNLSAPMFKLIRVPLNSTNATGEDVIKEQARSKLDWSSVVAHDKLILAYMEDVKTALYVHSLKDGKELYKIPLEIGNISGFHARKARTEAFALFESFLVPGTVYRLDFGGQEPVKPEVLNEAALKGIDASKFHVEQVFYESKDGTKVPMFVVDSLERSKNRDGKGATWLNAYGGFNVALNPAFSISRLLVVQHLGISVAVANLRGGCEYGEDWHRAGMREKKQNVFDDMIAAGEHLIANRFCAPDRLAIQGGSNGGLLMAAVSQQRPDLFAAVVNRVGVLDMLRYHKFTIGAAWVPEYGDPDNKDDFRFIHKYSPLHQLQLPQDPIEWPATLLMTAEHDDRVVPAHTLKYSAQLQHLLRERFERDGGKERPPVIVRVEVKAGHGAGKPTTKLIEECVDMFGFLQRTVRLTWTD